jgi:FtsP/CotA-like multicopper oxidase with cupredoxin domain
MSLKREAMRATTMKKAITKSSLLPVVMMALTLLFTAPAHAATPGITGISFSLTAQDAFLNQPDGDAVYSWGYGCAATFSPTFIPAAITAAKCPTMQVPGPTLVVTEGQTITVTLTNNLPTAAGNTSILFPGFQVCTGTITAGVCTPNASNGVTGLLAQEAVPGGSVTYTFVATAPGTHAYYSGTQGDLQIAMGLYGAVIVLPATSPANCTANTNTPAGGKPFAGANGVAEAYWGEKDFRLAPAAYNHASTCYDREYLFQWSEMDANIHHTALAQVTAKAGCVAGAPGCSLEVPTEPYHPAYFLINGRSMPDLMDANYGLEYPHQPYNGNPHMHPGEQVLVRAIGQGRWQHPFHEHGNHVRILGRDANLVLSANDTTTNPALAGLLMFNTDTTPGQAFEGIFYWSGRGLNWDPYGHNPNSTDPLATLPCTPDANGYNTGAPTAINYYEWCQDHNKPLEANPFGDVESGGPATLPNPNIFTNGPWYGGTPYLGPDATLRSSSTLRSVAPGTGSSGCVTGTTTVTAPAGANPTPNCSPLQPSNIQANPANERGFAFMWHSHNEREITTNNVFPGGMLMMMLVDSREFVIDESM